MKPLLTILLFDCCCMFRMTMRKECSLHHDRDLKMNMEKKKDLIEHKGSDVNYKGWQET